MLVTNYLVNVGVCCTDVFDSGVTVSCDNWYHMHLPTCVSIVLN